MEILNDIDLSGLKSLKDQNPKNPFLCHLNIKSLRHKIVDLGHVLNQTGIEIVAISETKLCSDFPDVQFQVDGYVYPPYRKDRTKHGGGIMVFVKNDLITKRKQEFESDSVEIISLELTISRKKWIIFSFYRPPKSNIANFFSELSKCVDKATRRYENVVLMGDINIDTSEEKAIGMTKLSEFCDIFDLVNLSTGGACETLNSSTSLDVIFTNKKRSFKNSGTIETGISDLHKMTITTMRVNYQRLQPIKVQYRSYKNFQEKLFLKDLK